MSGGGVLPPCGDSIALYEPYGLAFASLLLIMFVARVSWTRC